MKTPVCDFVKQYAQQNALRLHMPGHKGKSLLGMETLDITEIDGADVLYHPHGIIRESQDNAAKLFGAAKTVYSAGGATLCMQAMVHLLGLYAAQMDKAPLIAAGRNAHKSFLTAAALCAAEISWIWPERQTDAVSCLITPQVLERHLSQMEQLPVAVYITSPDYLGNLADIRGLSAVCRKYGVLLAVDNAHGAYLRFLPEDMHPLTLGAHLCCDSAHKTLPVLTGGAYLHLSGDAPGLLLEQAENAMALFASTSPSYLILQSLDAANAYLAEGYGERLACFAQKIAQLKKRLEGAGYTFVGQEPMKLTLAAKAYGYIGTELAQRLSEKGLVCEFSDPDYVVLMLTPENGDGALERLETALLSIEKKPAITQKMPLLDKPVVRMSPRQALMTVSRPCAVQDSLGKVLGSPAVSCPPAIPIVVCGEEINESAIRVMEYYGIENINIL